ncbi:hypothetical protein F4808DRAFT_465054 [Astrocystis sublimbata]|nr:hypothetical protein F4808DRAFT_465054 [Astrocystis sublimbata]
MPDYYAQLGVPHTANQATIQKSYSSKAVAASKDPKQSSKLSTAYQTLSDSSKRAEYDSKNGISSYTANNSTYSKYSTKGSSSRAPQSSYIPPTIPRTSSNNYGTASTVVPSSRNYGASSSVVPASRNYGASSSRMPSTTVNRTVARNPSNLAVSTTYGSSSNGKEEFIVMEETTRKISILRTDNRRR